MRTYLSGPMRGFPNENYPAFRAAATRLRAMGFEIISPVELNHGAEDDGTKPREHYLRNDLRALVDCSGIAVLPGWERSVGACAEAAVAISLAFQFFDASTGAPLPAPPPVAICGGYKLGAAVRRELAVSVQSAGGGARGMNALAIPLPRKADASACYAMGIWIARQATTRPLLLSPEQATRIAELLLAAGQYGVAGCRPPKAKATRGQPRGQPRGRKGAC